MAESTCRLRLAFEPVVPALVGDSELCFFIFSMIDNIKFSMQMYDKKINPQNPFSQCTGTVQQKTINDRDKTVKIRLRPYNIV